MIQHPGYKLDGFKTNHSIKDYNRMHDIDFCRLITNLGLERGVVVDVGCGNATFLTELQRKFPDIIPIGIDRKPYKHSIDYFVVGDARALPLRTGIADLAVSSAVSQWVLDRQEDVYLEIARILKPSGIGLVFPYIECRINIPNAQVRKIKFPNSASTNQLLIGSAEVLS